MLWRSAKQQIRANLQYPSIDAHALLFIRYVQQLSSRAALRKAGVLSRHFCLRGAQRLVLSLFFRAVLGIERIVHFETMTDVGFAILTGGHRKALSRSPLGRLVRAVSTPAVKAFTQARGFGSETESGSSRRLTGGARAGARARSAGRALDQ